MEGPADGSLSSAFQAQQQARLSPPWQGASAEGFLLLMRVDAGGELVDEEKGLVLAVGGDTMRSISQATQHKGPHDRPLALDLLWSILERGREISKRDWQLVRVAIVELRGSVFIGRLFFGDPASGHVVWDCDSRPSDSIWLALKAKCPLFVNKEVWAENATSLKEIRGDAQGGPPTDILQSPEGAEGAGAAERRRGGWRSKSVSPGRGSRAGPPPGAGGAQEAAAEEASALMTRIRPTDPEPLKRLKMEMRVALKEEDYGAAARIRDHPFMRMHIRILDHLKAGRQSEASDLEARLHDAVERYERSGGTEIMQFEE
ncbi:hypothetical protein N2152v2_009476 [Parachlorella kessleri]